MYVTIDYSTDSNGNITEAFITTKSYGNSFGNTYSQTGNGNMYFIGGNMVFQVPGQFTTSIGIGKWSATNSNNVIYSGFLPRNGGGGGFVKQEPNPNEEMPY